ncbi:hypothetical protein Aduo_018980 [Ancylostoma duodenale]
MPHTEKSDRKRRNAENEGSEDKLLREKGGWAALKEASGPVEKGKECSAEKTRHAFPMGKEFTLDFVSIGWRDQALQRFEEARNQGL